MLENWNRYTLFSIIRSSTYRLLACALLFFASTSLIVDGAVPPPGPRPGPTTNDCLAAAVYHEARGEPVAVQRAVLDTILHRKKHSGTDVCSVVSKKSQFSWYKYKGIEELDPQRATLLVYALAHPRILKDENFRFFYSGDPPYWAEAMTCRPIGHMHFCKLRRNIDSHRTRPSGHLRQSS